MPLLFLCCCFSLLDGQQRLLFCWLYTRKSGEAATEDDDKSRNDELPLPWSGPTAEIMDSLDEDNKQRQLVSILSMRAAKEVQ